MQELCGTAFPTANQKTYGRTTHYNRQASVQAVVCNGFGQTHFSLNAPAVACTLIAAAIHNQGFEKTSLFLDGSCSGAELATSGGVASFACGMLTDLLGVAPYPPAKVFSIAAGLSCQLGHAFGGWIESASERQAARGVMRSTSTCLKFTTHRFPLTDTWADERCAKGDKGFATLPTGPTAPKLGRVWASSQAGYGHVRPTTIFNGGDPTGLVQHIQWSGWGSSQAVGSGDAVWVWPGTAVGQNGSTSGAVVVAFHLGKCRGYSSYNAVEWYFPKYDETFNPSRYLDTCAGAYIGASPNIVDCPDVQFADGSGTATQAQAIQISCADASQLIAAAPASVYVQSGGRFIQSGFRCGTQGTLGLGSALFDCQKGDVEFLYSVSG